MPAKPLKRIVKRASGSVGSASLLLPTERPPEQPPERPPERPTTALPAERRPQRAKPAVARDALYDAPYVPRDSANAAAPESGQRAPKRQVAALFRTPIKSDSTEQ